MAQPDPSTLEAEYRRKGLDREANSFVLYRIIGNDLPPRHAVGQSRKNLKFILENEPDLVACEKRWIVNRIVDPDQERSIVRLLERHRQSYLTFPFDWDAYRRIGWAVEDFPYPGFLDSAEFTRLDAEKQERARTQNYRLKNNYVMNNNGARNLALSDGVQRAKWVLPWDGNCFLTSAAWEEIRKGVSRSPHFKYFIVPMARVTDNRALLDRSFRPDADEEPQILFRRDAAERFDEAHPYGRRPKVELFWRLGVPGVWSDWSIDPWDLPFPSLSPEAGQFRVVGWVARLFSGVGDLEQASEQSYLRRGVQRTEAIQKLLDRIDAEASLRSEF